MHTNEVVLVGVVEKGPHHYTYSDGTTVTRLVIAWHSALDEAHSDETHRPTAYWINIEVWGEAADTVARHIRKDWLVRITGYLKANRWKDEYQCQHIDTVVVARRLEFEVPTDEGFKLQTVKSALAPSVPERLNKLPMVIRVPAEFLYTLDLPEPPVDNLPQPPFPEDGVPF